MTVWAAVKSLPQKMVNFFIGEKEQVMAIETFITDHVDSLEHVVDVLETIISAIPFNKDECAKLVTSLDHVKTMIADTRANAEAEKVAASAAPTHRGFMGQMPPAY